MRPQTITFASPPSPGVNQASVTVSATASSGLPVRYGTRTPARCMVGPASGVVTATRSGTCTVTANQPGNEKYAPAPAATQDVTFTFLDVIEFATAPPLAVHDQATVTAVASTGAPVAYASATPASCSVDPASGLVTALAEGDCTVDATSGQLHASLTIPISAAPPAGIPEAPTGVAASAGESPGTVTVRVGAVAARGRPITAYSVTSSPAGLTGTGPASPVTVTCPSSCAGHRFSVAATNDQGTGPPSAPADVVTAYSVVATFHEPDTQPNDSIFAGSFTLDATTGAVSGLRGRLSESMTGGSSPYPDDSMTWLPLEHQLSSVPVALDGEAGLLVTAFLLDITDTLSPDPRFGGTDGWSPGTGTGLHFGFPGGVNPGNAYARILVDPADPTGAPTQAQLDRLAYADCTPLGMMGSTCMTGTSVAGYGTLGTMGGHPVSQVTTRR
jgi:hypothetical protein